MDPFAHTLVGATLAETGLRRTTPLATATLIIGANLPDVDIVSSAMGGDASLYFRRGITHGIVAMMVLPVLLAGGMLVYDRWRRRGRVGAERARLSALLGLSFVAVLSHPALDWLNTYGVRLLFPFDERWFYGDSLFIVDPWMWLLMAAAVVLARSNARPSQAAWIVLGVAATALVTSVEYVPIAARVCWLVGVGAIVLFRMLGTSEARTRRLARVTLSVLALYVAAMVGGSALARAQTRDWLAARSIQAIEIMAGPLPANPFIRDIVAVTRGGYRFYTLRWLEEPRFVESYRPLAGDVRNEVIDAALDVPSVRGFRTWMRFPTYEIEEHEQGYDVTIRDVRYSRFDALIGTTVVRLDRDLRPTGGK